MGLIRVGTTLELLAYVIRPGDAVLVDGKHSAGARAGQSGVGIFLKKTSFF